MHCCPQLRTAEQREQSVCKLLSEGGEFLLGTDFCVHALKVRCFSHKKLILGN